MRMDQMDNSGHYNKESKNRKSRTVIKILAVIFVVIAIILIVIGLMPSDRIPRTDRELQGGYLNCFTGIYAEKGDILVIDYTVYGSDVAFYLTADESYCEGNLDYIEKSDHAVNDHFEVNVEKSGYYYMSFESNEPSNTETFTVELSYKLMNTYSPLHLIGGVMSLACGLVFTILFFVLRKRDVVPVQEYIRI